MKPSYAFPDDICTRICEFIHSQGPKPLFTRFQANATLKSLSTTSKAWSFASRSTQYEKVFVRTAVQLANLLLVLKSPNYLATHIRGLAIGKGFDAPIDLSSWSTVFVDFRVFEILLPHLQGLKIGKINCLQLPEDEVFRSFDHITLPNHSRLTALTLRARFFHDTAEAAMFFGALQELRQLCFQDVWPSFVRMLPTYLPPSVRGLRLEEYALWELEGCTIHGPIPPSPPIPNLSLDHFHYRDLSVHAARELESTLIAFASGARVKIEFIRAHFICPEFDLSEFQVHIRSSSQSVWFLFPCN